MPHRGLSYLLSITAYLAGNVLPEGRSQPSVARTTDAHVERKIDQYGDVLPCDAIARMGNRRWSLAAGNRTMGRCIGHVAE